MPVIMIDQMTQRIPAVSFAHMHCVSYTVIHVMLRKYIVMVDLPVVTKTPRNNRLHAGTILTLAKKLTMANVN